MRSMGLSHMLGKLGNRRRLTMKIGISASVFFVALLFIFFFTGPRPFSHAAPLLLEPDIFYPPGAVINVKTDYGAKGDGVTDDTEAILNAIKENIGNEDPSIALIYFPEGTYLVSDRLEAKDELGVWQANLSLLGQNRAKTIIKLKNNAPGYGNPTEPKAVIFTASFFFQSDTAGGKDWPGLGEGNVAFRNFIFDLTIDTGLGNPGAIGVDYLVSNMGAMRNVNIRSGDGQGHTGLSMVRKWPGPGLIKNVHIDGFDTGIALGEVIASMTFEDITLENQNKIGIFNDGNVISIRNLQSTNSVPVIRNIIKQGLITLIDGNFNGGLPSVSSIENNAGQLFVRNVQVTGYQSAILDQGVIVPGNDIPEFVSTDPFNLFDSPFRSLNLPVQNTPELLPDPPNEWANVLDLEFGADGSGNQNFDNAPAFQAAIDSGATTIYVPPGLYLFKDTVHIRGNVKRLDFMNSWFGVDPSNLDLYTVCPM